MQELGFHSTLIPGMCSFKGLLKTFFFFGRLSDMSDKALVESVQHHDDGSKSSEVDSSYVFCVSAVK